MRGAEVCPVFGVRVFICSNVSSSPDNYDNNNEDDVNLIEGGCLHGAANVVFLVQLLRDDV